MLKLGLPSKGRLQKQTIEWFAKHDVIIERTGNDREYSGRIEGHENVELVLLSAGEIPSELSAGRIHLGVTGQDLVHEKIIAWDNILSEVTQLGFGHANLVLAVPKVWIDVTSLDDFDAVAAAFRKKHGFRLRIATKYHNITRKFFHDMGVADYQLIDSQGATEGTIKNQTAEAIADITSSGETLEANHLKVISDGVILKSQATLYVSKVADWGKDDREALQRLDAVTNLNLNSFLTD